MNLKSDLKQLNSSIIVSLARSFTCTNGVNTLGPMTINESISEHLFATAFGMKNEFFVFILPSDKTTCFISVL